MKLTELLTHIVDNSELHGRFLNTLSYLENCGARLLAGCQHPTLVREEMLKHAAEEFRHAYYLKFLMRRVATNPLDSYHRSHLLGGYPALHLLPRLNLAVSRQLVQLGYQGATLKGVAYVLVSYAIEVRAKQLYPTYQKTLRVRCPKVSIRSIIVEEEHHLAEMEKEVDALPNGWDLAEQICAIEQELTRAWLRAVASECKAALQLT